MVFVPNHTDALALWYVILMPSLFLRQYGPTTAGLPLIVQLNA